MIFSYLVAAKSEKLPMTNNWTINRQSTVATMETTTAAQIKNNIRSVLLLLFVLLLIDVSDVGLLMLMLMMMLFSFCCC